MVLPKSKGNLTTAPSGKRKTASIKTATEHWSEYALDDGNIIKIRPVILEITRIIGQTTADGKPLYEIKGTMVMDVNVKNTLRKTGAPKRGYPKKRVAT